MQGFDGLLCGVEARHSLPLANGALWVFWRDENRTAEQPKTLKPQNGPCLRSFGLVGVLAQRSRKNATMSPLEGFLDRKTAGLVAGIEAMRLDTHQKGFEMGQEAGAGRARDAVAAAPIHWGT